MQTFLFQVSFTCFLFFIFQTWSFPLFLKSQVFKVQQDLQLAWSMWSFLQGQQFFMGTHPGPTVESRGSIVLAPKPEAPNPEAPSQCLSAKSAPPTRPVTPPRPATPPRRTAFFVFIFLSFKGELLLFNFHFISKCFLLLTWQDLWNLWRKTSWQRAKTPQQPPEDAVWGSFKKGRKEEEKRSRTTKAEAAWCRAGPEGSGQTARRWKKRGWQTDEDKGEPPAEKGQRRSGEKTSESRRWDKEGAPREDGGGSANAEVDGGSWRTRCKGTKARDDPKGYKRRWGQGKQKKRKSGWRRLRGPFCMYNFPVFSTFMLNCFPILGTVYFFLCRFRKLAGSTKICSFLEREIRLQASVSCYMSVVTCFHLASERSYALWGWTCRRRACAWKQPPR